MKTADDQRRRDVQKVQSVEIVKIKYEGSQDF